MRFLRVWTFQEAEQLRHFATRSIIFCFFSQIFRQVMHSKSFVCQLKKNPQQTSWEAISLWKCQDPVRKWQILKEENCGASQQNVNVMIRWHDYQHYIVSGLCGFRAWLIRQIVSSLKYLTKSLVVMDTHRSGGPITSIQFDLIQSCFIPFDSP